MQKSSKTRQLQIRVSSADKAAIHKAARRAGMDMSAYVLARVLPRQERRFRELVARVDDPDSGRFALAELNSLLASLSAPALQQAVAEAPPATLSAYASNYVAAMVEYACGRYRVRPPRWTHAIEVMSQPEFGTGLHSLRLHLLTRSPPPFRRRNIFIDTSLGGQV